MAAKLNQNGIQFNEIEVSAKSTGAVLSHSPYLDLNGNFINSRYTGDIQTPIQYINAIDINWNGAVLEKNGVTLKTSGDLLNQLEVIWEKFSNYSTIESIEEFTHQISQISDIANQALELAQNFEQVNADWNATEGVSVILNKPEIPTSIYGLEDWEDFATQNWVNNRLRLFNSAYDIYAEQQRNIGNIPLSEEDWIESLHGTNGTNGLSAYELAVQNGLTNLTESEWIKSLKAKDGWSAYEIALNNGFTGTEEEWLLSLKGEQGDQGKSAYEVAVEFGFEGTEEEWLVFIKGEKGDKGDKGDPGKDGNSVQILGTFDTVQELYEEVEGKYFTLGSAYLVDGYLYVYNDSGETIQEQWRNVGQIKGPKGDKGDQGERGEQGIQGKSTYDIYKELQILAGEEVLPEAEWLESLKVNTIYTAGNGILISGNTISLDTNNTWITIN